MIAFLFDSSCKSSALAVTSLTTKTLAIYPLLRDSSIHEFLKYFMFFPSTRCLKCFDEGGVSRGGDAQAGCDDTYMSFMNIVRLTPFKKMEIKGKGEMDVWILVQDVSLRPLHDLFQMHAY